MSLSSLPVASGMMLIFRALTPCRRAMQQFGKFADEAKTAIEEQDVARLADLMDSNFK